MCSTRLCVFYLLAITSLGAAKNEDSECLHFNAKRTENEFSCVKNDTSKKISCSLSPSDGRKTESIVFLCDGRDQWNKHVTHENISVIEAKNMRSKPCEMEITYSGILKVSVVAKMKRNSSLELSLKSNGKNKVSVENKTCLNKWQEIEVEINSTNKSVFSINRKLQKGKGYWAISDIKFYTQKQAGDKDKNNNTFITMAKSTTKMTPTTDTKNSANKNRVSANNAPRRKDPTTSLVATNNSSPQSLPFNRKDTDKDKNKNESTIKQNLTTSTQKTTTITSNQQTDTTNVQSTAKTTIPILPSKKNIISTNNVNKNEPTSLGAPKDGSSECTHFSVKQNENEFSCVKDDKSKKISCSPSSSDGSHTESILLLCDDSDKWSKNVIVEKNLHKTRIKDLVIKRNALEISNLENKTYKFSVCSMETFTINQIQVIKRTEKNDGFENQYVCTNWTKFILTKYKTSNGSGINIVDEKGTNENTSLSIGEFANTHAYLHIRGNKASFWKLHELKVIEANMKSSKPCEMEITHSGILRVSVIAYMKHTSSLEISLKSNGTNSTSVESKTCPDKWQEIEFKINSTNKSVFSINRKLQIDKGYWAISDIRFYTTNQTVDKFKNKNNSITRHQSTASFTKTTSVTTTTTKSSTTTAAPKNCTNKNTVLTTPRNEDQTTFVVAPENSCPQYLPSNPKRNENEFSCVKDNTSKTISCSFSSSNGGKTKSIVLLCAGSRNWNKNVTHEKTQKEVKIIEANTTSNKSCEMEITYSGILKVSVIAKMKDNSSLVVLLKSNGKNNTSNESKSCPGEWQKIDLQIDSTNTSYFSINRKLYDGKKGYWAIREIRFYTIKSKSCTTESCGSARKTTEKTTTKSSLPSNTAPANSTTKNISNNSTSHTAALICLIVLLVLTLILLGYLYYAYRKSKYPFDVRRPESRDPDDFFEEERKEFSDFHKRHMVKTVRTKADPPIKESELEVFIEPTNKFESNISSLPTKIKDFEDYLMTSLGDDPYSNDLTRQYRTMQGKTQKSATAGSQTKYIGKNRYRNLIAFDNTRVILRDNDCDYINANYIDGFENKKAFIATQAPLKSTLGDFWCMIWQEKVTTIVMLTELIENGVTKCEQYWPDVEQKARYGKILIENISVNLYSDYIERTLSVKCGEEVRMIRHLQYVTWPDHGVPVYPQNFTPFIKKLLLISQKESPIVVHCNAGCGRTGTLILCDIVLRMAAKEKTLDFVKVLKKMREQRANLVNNVNQYVFAHFVVLECLFGIDFSIAVNDSFQDEVDKVLRKITIKPMMEHLDKVMEQFKKRQACFFPNMSDDDKKKNRFSKILPSHTQLFLPMSSENPSSYINAVVVDCYRCPKKFIVTQQPLPNTINDFWTVIKEFEVNTVVSLNEIGENDPDCPQFWHWSNESTTMKIINEEENRTFSTLKVKITDESNQKEKTVNVLNMKGWKRNIRYPTKSNDLILVWKEMFSSSWKGDSQIVVTCYDGATASGLFVALAYLLEKINYEQTCDVFSAIRTVRQCREEFVQEWGQMEFLYKAAKVYIEEFDNYDNFSV